MPEPEMTTTNAARRWRYVALAAAICLGLTALLGGKFQGFLNSPTDALSGWTMVSPSGEFHGLLFAQQPSTTRPSPIPSEHRDH